MKRFTLRLAPEGVQFYNLDPAATVTATRFVTIAAWACIWFLGERLRVLYSAWQLHVDGKVRIGTLAIIGSFKELRYLGGKRTRRCGLVALLLLSAYLIDYGGGLILVNTTKQYDSCGIHQLTTLARPVSMQGAQFYNHTDYTRAIELLYKSAQIPTGDIPGVVVHDPTWQYVSNLSAGTIKCEATQTSFNYRGNVSLGVRSSAFAFEGFPTQPGQTGPPGYQSVQYLFPDVPQPSIRYGMGHGRYMQPCASDPQAQCATNFDHHCVAAWPDTPTSFNLLLINVYKQFADPINLGRLNGTDLRVPYTLEGLVPASLCKVSFTNPDVVSRWGEMNLPYPDRFTTYVTNQLTKEWGINVRTAILTNTTPQEPKTNPIDLITRLILTIGTDLAADDQTTSASFSIPCSVLSWVGVLTVVFPIILVLLMTSYLAYVLIRVGVVIREHLELIPVAASEWAGLAIKEATGLDKRAGCKDVFEEHCEVWLEKTRDGVRIRRWGDEGRVLLRGAERKPAHETEEV
ncbi:uncharacterized protein EV422DRAFT_571848 [Fimicolochytrium jonesii]|uniref:uncharacterized protein n=1 Tax=Fimicolochytrium jonesii TaxID=1396493 RepID=UPI0022FDF148|nr:uncharacterized protein EV422DRAFT_571848 [Fimicolochytrium jonesii]KAI8816281.1 hypothetical protein EV422DRAFT_571848 [Fimicolochytrium jonesii]